MALFHYADCRSEGFFGITLICAEGKVYDHEGAGGAFHYGFCMVYHLIKGNRKGGDIACHYIRGGISDEYYVDAGGINYFR